MQDGDLPAPTAAGLFQVDLTGASLIALAGLALAVWYLAGAIRLWRRGRRWPVMRTVSFLVGCLLVVAVTALGMNRYASQLVWVLMLQQLTLMTVVPPLLILGSPGRLLLRATPHRGAGLVLLRAAHAGLRSRAGRIALHPLMVVLIAVAMFPALYLTDAVSLFMATGAGHDVLLGLFLVLGIVGGVPLWSDDPLPRAPSYAARLVDIFAEIQIHAVLGLVLLLNSSALFAAYADPPPSWGITPAFDQSVAGVLLWTYGAMPLLLVLIFTMSRWRRRDLTLAVRRQDRDDEELEEYNARLRALAAHDATPPPPPPSPSPSLPPAPGDPRA